jgi:FAD/FMN-containing dehydrogenase
MNTTLNQAPALQRLIDQVLAARDAKTALDIRGGGSKAFYGGAACGEPMDMRALSGISSHEPSELVVTVRAGTPLAELEAALAEHGQCLPFEPPRFAPLGVTNDPHGPVTPTSGALGGLHQAAIPPTGTVGGLVAAGLAGPARACVGSVRDYVLGATLLNGQGEVLSFGGQVIKNVAGYDVSRLMAGSMGVLGVICEVSLKVLPVAPATATLAFDCSQAEALQRLAGWASQPLPVNASAWFHGRLHLRLSGASAAVQAACMKLGGRRLETDEAAPLWDSLRDQRHAFFGIGAVELARGMRLWRLSVRATSPPLALPGETLVEWQGAQRWWVGMAPAAEVRAAAEQAGGHATLYRAADKADGVFAPLADPLMRIHRGLKAAFDPDGLFNPGRLYADL